MLSKENLEELKRLFEIDGHIIHEAFQNAMEDVQNFISLLCPKQVPGYVFWGRLVQNISEAVAFAGNSIWVSKTVKNKPYLISERLKKVIFFASGNEATGTSDDPRLRRIGTITKEMIAVNENKFQKQLFPNTPLQDSKSLMDMWKLNEIEVWTLVYHMDKDAKTVQCEVSKPVPCDSPNDCLWEIRHRLPLFTFSEPVEVADDQSAATLSTASSDSSTTEMVDTNVDVTKKEASISETTEKNDNKE